jgi:hypothetical protein
MKRKIVVFLLVGLLLSLTLSLYSPNASAHTSTYCGHGHSGIFPRHVHYSSSYWEKSWHFHVYTHYVIAPDGHLYDHTAHKVCPGH